MKTLALLLAALSLTACGSMNNRFAPELLSDTMPDGKGVVILSTGAKETCVSTATFLKVKEASQPYTGGELALLGVDPYVLKSDFADHHGNIHALSLPAGRYYFAPWLANPYFKPIRLPRYDFLVNANEVVYLGEFFLTVQCGTSTQGAFSDKAERDLQMVKARKPSLNLDSVRKAIAVQTGLAVGD